jgi:6-phosphogluconolactonase/glucosamine-6-phosphate isomerase/deaminase
MTQVRRLILDGAPAVARAAADLLAEEVAAQREIVLALPTGRTPIPFYDELAARQAAGSLDLTHARGFNLDELVLPRHDPRTFRAFMEQHAWGRTTRAASAWPFSAWVWTATSRTTCPAPCAWART